MTDPDVTPIPPTVYLELWAEDADGTALATEDLFEPPTSLDVVGVPAVGDQLLLRPLGARDTDGDWWKVVARNWTAALPDGSPFAPCQRVFLHIRRVEPQPEA